MKLYTFGPLFFITSQLVSGHPTTTIGKRYKTRSDYSPQVSPHFSKMHKLSGAVSTYDPSRELDTDSELSRTTLNLKTYPEPWEKADIDHPDVRRIIDSIDWSLVPEAPVRSISDDGGFDFSEYDGEDPFCWWSASNCVHPKTKLVPDDIYTCPRSGEWGLTFDDGPYNLRDDYSEYATSENPFAEPYLYNVLAENNLKSTLFYIGSNVVTYPAAAQRALNDGHYICAHTWSHVAMTTQTNEEAVAELYWSLRAIKEATGITPKCWRPPQGDVDDRIRSIAWQMGLRTVLWDRDTRDWAMPAPGGSDYAPEKVDRKFRKWIREEENGEAKHGIIVLQHELNHATVSMATKWLDEIQSVFKILPALACNDITQPYWETNFEYPQAYDY